MRKTKTLQNQIAYLVSLSQGILVDRIWRNLKTKKKELENENHILKMNNTNDLTSKIIELENKLFELTKENGKIRQQNELKESKIKI